MLTPLNTALVAAAAPQTTVKVDDSRLLLSGSWDGDSDYLAQTNTSGAQATLHFSSGEY